MTLGAWASLNLSMLTLQAPAAAARTLLFILGLGACASGSPAGGAGGLASGGRAGISSPAAGSGSGSAGRGAAGNGSGGVAGQQPAAGSGGAAGRAAAEGGSSGSAAASNKKFSFFVTSVSALQQLSNSDQGFGGDLRFGKATGLEGADEICRQIAERSLPGSGAKGWRAFLSATAGGPNGGPIHAKDRIGAGPWYDRLERLVAANSSDLLQTRPRGADPAIINDLPNENGVPNHSDGAPGCTGNTCPDNHQVLTGTNEMGMLKSMDPATTCNDWSNAKEEGMPWCGHSWPRQGSGQNWMSSAADGGCAPCVSLVEMGGVRAPCVGSAGGYGGFYCFALQP